MTLTAKLREFPGLPPDYIATAEKRFRTALGKQLRDNVERVLKAYSNATESGNEEMNEDERALASAGPKAYAKAKSAGFRDLGAADEGYFGNPARLRWWMLDAHLETGTGKTSARSG